MRRIVLPCTLVLALSLCATPLFAQVLDVAGDWSLELTVQLPGEGGGSCEFGGYAQVMQTGSTFSGPAKLFLVSGDPACPAEMTADISGTVDGGMLNGTLEGGNLGTASFTGSLIGKADGPLGGDTTVNTGPFAGAVGNWAAVIFSIPIPALTPRALALLAGLLVAVGLGLLYRQRIAA